MPENSAIKVDRNLEEALKNASHEEIKELLKDAAVEQRIAVREWDQSIVTPVNPGTDPKAYARAIVIDGTKHIVSGASEIELEKAVGDLYRAQLQPAATTTEQPARDTSTGRFTSQAEPSVSQETKDALQLQFQLGQISASEYLEKSGSISDYLEKAGIPLDLLRDSV